MFYRPEREAEILTRVKRDNTGPLPDSDMAHLFREIISCCLALEQPLTIAYLGPSGTYTEAAAIKQFGHFGDVGLEEVAIHLDGPPIQIPFAIKQDQRGSRIDIFFASIQ